MKIDAWQSVLKLLWIQETTEQTSKRKLHQKLLQTQPPFSFPMVVDYAKELSLHTLPIL